MLTKKKISLLIIMFVFTSCWWNYKISQWEVEKKEKVEKIEYNGGEWKKGKAIWGLANHINNYDNSAFSGVSEKPTSKPVYTK